MLRALLPFFPFDKSLKNKWFHKTIFVLCLIMSLPTWYAALMSLILLIIGITGGTLKGIMLLVLPVAWLFDIVGHSGIFEFFQLTQSPIGTPIFMIIIFVTLSIIPSLIYRISLFLLKASK